LQQIDLAIIERLEIKIPQFEIILTS
jgi:hypothetical protein